MQRGRAHHPFTFNLSSAPKARRMIDKAYALGKRLALLCVTLGMVALAACSAAPNANANLYAIASEKAYAILDDADLAASDPDVSAALSMFNPTKDNPNDQEIMWQFAAGDLNYVNAHIHLAAEGQSTRITTSIMFLESAAKRQDPANRDIVATLDGLIHFKTVLHLYFTECVDATLTARTFDPEKGGEAYWHAHQAELAAELQRLHDLVAKHKAQAAQQPATPAAGTAPAAASSGAGPVDPTRPLVNGNPTMMPNTDAPSAPLQQQSTANAASTLYSTAPQ